MRVFLLSQRTEELTKALNVANDESSLCKTSLAEVQGMNEEYQVSLESVRKELRLSEEEMVGLAKDLAETEEANELLKNEVSESKDIVENLRAEIRESQNRLAEKSEVRKEKHRRRRQLIDLKNLITVFNLPKSFPAVSTPFFFQHQSYVGVF